MDNLLPIVDNLNGDILIAGPCSAETREQTLTTAKELADIGVQIYRAGLWKPRTHPGNFEGVGEEGIPWLEEVKRLTGMKVCTEVATRSHLEQVLDSDIDMIWIGARTTSNPFAVQELADLLAASNRDIPVLVKNPVSPDIELWIGALQRFYNAGIRRLCAIHRGFSRYGSMMYRNDPMWRIPAELRRREPQLPIICDPSHIGGKKDLIEPISKQAYNMGFDGLIIESHCQPEKAWSDSAQQITPHELNNIINQITPKRGVGEPEMLDEMRHRIDETDTELLEILARRLEICREIGEYKKLKGMSVLQRDRYDKMIRSRVQEAETLGLDSDFVGRLLGLIHEESVKKQLEIYSNTINLNV